MPTLWQDLRPEDFGPTRTAPLFDYARPTAIADELLAEPGTLFEPVYCSEPGCWKLADGYCSEHDGARRWFVVACSGRKLDEPAPAWQLYTGSMFRHTFDAAEAAAKRAGGRVLILSAAHGLIEPERELAPYDVKLGAIGSVVPVEVRGHAWQLGIRPGDVVTMLLPREYRNTLTAALEREGVQLVDAYDGCRGIGEQRARNWSMMQAANND